MYHSDFDPYGQRKKKFSLFGNKAENPIVVTFQLFLIFLVVRLAMIAGGILLIRIPYIDDYLAKIVNLIPR